WNGEESGVHPAACLQELVWLESGFIGHFTAFLDPVTEVKPGQPCCTALFDLPEDGPGAQAAGGFRLEKGVDRREAVCQHIDDRNNHQSPFRIAEFREAGIDPAGQQKLSVLARHVIVHAGARMTMQLVTLIELEMGFVPAQAGHAYCERFLARPGTTLASAGAKGVDVDPNGKAGAAVVA